MKIRERLGNFAWKILLPMFRFKWWFRDRDQRKEFRRHQEWEYMLHSWKTCMFMLRFVDSDRDLEIWGCTYRSRFRMLRDRLPRKRWFGIPSCRKKRCKNYVHDPIKGASR